MMKQLRMICGIFVIMAILSIGNRSTLAYNELAMVNGTGATIVSAYMVPSAYYDDYGGDWGSNLLNNYWHDDTAVVADVSDYTYWHLKIVFFDGRSVEFKGIDTDKVHGLGIYRRGSGNYYWMQLT